MTMDYLACYEAAGLVVNPTGSKGWHKALCPFHSDTEPSLSVSQITGRWRCFAGCGHGTIEEFFDRQHLPLPEGLPSPQGSGPDTKAPPPGKIDKTYDYTTLTGELVHQTVRLKPKAFRQRRPDSKGGW